MHTDRERERNKAGTLMEFVIRNVCLHVENISRIIETKVNAADKAPPFLLFSDLSNELCVSVR